MSEDFDYRRCPNCDVFGNMGTGFGKHECKELWYVYEPDGGQEIEDASKAFGDDEKEAAEHYFADGWSDYYENASEIDVVVLDKYHENPKAFKVMVEMVPEFNATETEINNASNS